MARRAPDDERDGVELTNLDQPVFDGAEATKRDLVDYLDAVSARMLPGLTRRPLSVIRARPGAAPFMQKNLPKHAPDWIARVETWAETSQRTVTYALCEDRRTLLWFANQRAIEYHPTLTPMETTETHEIVLDLDPPEGGDFALVVAAAKLVREALTGVGLDAAVKTSGAKGLHIVAPLAAPLGIDDAFAVTRAICRPRRGARRGRRDHRVHPRRPRRPGVPRPDPRRLGDARRGVQPPRPPRPAGVLPAGAGTRSTTSCRRRSPCAPRWNVSATPIPWRELRPEPGTLADGLVDEGKQIPVPRVQAMHEGKRRKRARERQES